MRLNNQILGNLRENKEDWYYLCNDAEQALFKVKNECKDERAIKSIERMILELNNIRMEQYNALTEYALIEDEVIYSNLDNMVDALRTNFKGITNKDYIKKSLRLHYDYGFISEDEYKELYKEFVSNENFDESSDSYSEAPKITVSIYQIRDVANTDYAFRGYDEVADKIDLADYDKVATIDLPDNDDVLETVFMYGNTDKSKFNEIKPMRSISVSDIIDYDDTMYYVDSFGFKEL